MRVRLLQFGDLHLDAPFTALSDVEGKPFQRRQDLKRTLSGIIDLAFCEKPDIVLVCGDLYEHGYTSKSTIHYVCDQFSRIPGIPVLMIPGNHDPNVAGSFYSEHEWPPNVHVLGRNDIFEHSVSGTRVYGGYGRGLVDPGCINILMHHGTLDMPFSSGAYQPITGSEAESKGFDYCALGHFHSRISGDGAKGIFYNAGSPEPLGFDEEGDHGVYLSVIEKEPGNRSSIKTDFIKLCSRHAVNLDVDISGSLNSEQAAVSVACAMDKKGSCDDLFRIFLSGRICPDVRIETETVAELLAGKAFYIKVIDNTQPDYDLEEIAREPGLRGVFTRKMLDKAAASDPKEAKLVMQALYYGLEAINEGKVCI